MDRFITHIQEAVDWLVAEKGVTIAPPRIISDNQPTPLDDLVQRTLDASCDAVGAGHRRMASGAGHDAAWMARVTRSGMVFIPCLGGRSHAPEDFAKTEDIALGAAVLLDAVQRLDKELD